MSTLYLAVKKCWFDEMKAGTKTEEYREMTPHWIKRLSGKNFKTVVITLGYPPKNNLERRLVFPWHGYDVKSIQHPHFGNRRIMVFAIKLDASAKESP